jgi:hypothetical protein
MWKEQFDKRFCGFSGLDKMFSYSNPEETLDDEIKAFISKTLLSLLEDLEKRVEGMTAKHLDALVVEDSIGVMVAFSEKEKNKALSQVLSLLQEYKSLIK